MACDNFNCKTQAFIFLEKMPVSLTIWNIPDHLYLRLKLTADSNLRSINSQAIVSLDSALPQPKRSVEKWLARVDALRQSIDQKFKVSDIDRCKRIGRK